MLEFKEEQVCCCACNIFWNVRFGIWTIKKESYVIDAARRLSRLGIDL